MGNLKWWHLPSSMCGSFRPGLKNCKQVQRLAEHLSVPAARKVRENPGSRISRLSSSHLVRLPPSQLTLSGKGEWCCWCDADYHQPMAQPAFLRERFTVSIGPDGAAVQRSLGKMTAAEVLAAIAWHTSEAERLAREAAPARPVAEALIETGAVPDGVTPEMLRHYSELLQGAETAHQRLEQLLMLVRDAMPGGAASDVGMTAAVRRFWRPQILNRYRI
jgi:hypothetical protein